MHNLQTYACTRVQKTHAHTHSDTNIQTLTMTRRITHKDMQKDTQKFKFEYHKWYRNTCIIPQIFFWIPGAFMDVFSELIRMTKNIVLFVFKKVQRQKIQKQFRNVIMFLMCHNMTFRLHLGVFLSVYLCLLFCVCVCVFD